MIMFFRGNNSSDGNRGVWKGEIEVCVCRMMRREERSHREAEMCSSSERMAKHGQTLHNKYVSRGGYIMMILRLTDDLRHLQTYAMLLLGLVVFVGIVAYHSSNMLKPKNEGKTTHGSKEPGHTPKKKPLPQVFDTPYNVGVYII
jgi:hypothetical protein